MQVTRQHFPGAQSIARYAKELGFVVFFAREQQITDELVLRNEYILWKLLSASNSLALTYAIPRDRNRPAPVAGRSPCPFATASGHASQSIPGIVPEAVGDGCIHVT